jgi:hypothetical protein
MQDKAGLSTANLTSKEAREQKEKLYWAVGSFWGSMLAHTLSDNEFKSGLVSRIAVLSLDTSTGS